MILGIRSYGIILHIPMNIKSFLWKYASELPRLKMIFLYLITMSYVNNIENKRNFMILQVHIAAMPWEDSIGWSSHWLTPSLAYLAKAIINKTCYLNNMFIIWEE